KIASLSNMVRLNRIFRGAPNSLGSCKIKFSRKILISRAYQIQCLLISALYVDASYAYPAKNLTQTGNIGVINTDEISSQVIIHTLEYIADNSQITKSISTNSQGAHTKTYKIKPANADSKIHDYNQANELNLNTMKWESELKSFELLKSGAHNSTSNPKFR
ncbi:hypothetical protein, partial [Methylotenera sp.]|uniref:hypothetical protein n=1 Tax=Methylotenera sp. TaxID=2051956 RepID=UPI0024890D5D